MAILNWCKKCKMYRSKKYTKCPECKASLKNPEKFLINLPNGKKRITRVCDTNITDARNLEAKIKADLKQEKWFEKKSAPRMKDVYKSLRKYNKKRLKDTTHFRTRWKKWIEPFITDSTTMADFTSSDVHKIVEKMQSTGGNSGNGCSPGTVNHVIKMLRRLYNYAANQEPPLYSGPNPAEKVELLKVPVKQMQILTKGQNQHFIEVLEDYQDQRFAQYVLFALYTGCRKSEIAKLKWTEVALDRKEVFLSDPKGHATVLPISSKACDCIKAMKAVSHNKAFIFIDENGKKRTQSRRAWGKLKKVANLPESFRFHDLRHNFASHMAMSGKISIFQLQKLLNHADIKMSMRYAHFFPSLIRDAADSVDSVFEMEKEPVKIKRRKKK